MRDERTTPPPTGGQNAASEAMEGTLTRSPSFAELPPEAQIQRLAEVVAHLGQQNRMLNEHVRALLLHQHGGNGEIVVPLRYGTGEGVGGMSSIDRMLR